MLTNVKTSSKVCQYAQPLTPQQQDYLNSTLPDQCNNSISLLAQDIYGEDDFSDYPKPDLLVALESINFRDVFLHHETAWQSALLEPIGWNDAVGDLRNVYLAYAYYCNQKDMSFMHHFNRATLHRFTYKQYEVLYSKRGYSYE